MGSAEKRRPNPAEDASEKDALLVPSVSTVPGVPRGARYPSIGRLEYVVFVYYAVLVSQQPITQEYLYQRLNSNVSDKASGGNPQTGSTTWCLGNLTVQSNDYIQECASRWSMVIELAAIVAGIVSTVVLGAYTDQRGRKIGLLLPTVGALVRSALTMVVVRHGAPIPFLALGTFLEGCFGFYGGMFAASFAYIADITTGKQRSFRITLLQGLLATSVGVSNLATGYLIEYLGFFYPILIGLILMLLNLLVIVFFIPNSVPSTSSSTLCSCSTLTSTFRTYFMPRDGGRRMFLLTTLVVILLVEMVAVGRMQLSVIFVVGSPFYWKSEKVGLFLFSSVISHVVVLLVFIKVLQRFLRRTSIIALGLLSIIGELVLFALAKTDTMLFLSPVAGLFGAFPVAVGMGTMSSLVGSDQQGSLFGGVSVVQVACSAVAVAIFNPIYQVTVELMPGLVFVVMAAVILLALILVTCLAVFVERDAISPDLLPYNREVTVTVGDPSPYGSTGLPPSSVGDPSPYGSTGLTPSSVDDPSPYGITGLRPSSN